MIPTTRLRPSSMAECTPVRCLFAEEIVLLWPEEVMYELDKMGGLDSTGLRAREI